MADKIFVVLVILGLIICAITALVLAWFIIVSLFSLGFTFWLTLIVFFIGYFVGERKGSHGASI